MADSLGAFLVKKVDPKYFYCRPLLPKQGKMFIGAVAKSFKSMLALNIGYDLAEGVDVLGMFPCPVPRRVLLIEMEIGEERLKERLVKIHNKRQGKTAPDNLWIVSKDLDCRLDTIEGNKLIEQHITQVRPHVVIFDPLRKFHNLDEDKSTAMAALFQNLSKMQKRYDFACIIVHHFGKPTEGRPSSSPMNLRGSSFLFDEGDSYISGTNPDYRDKTLIQLSFVLRSDEDPFPQYLDLDSKSLTFGKKSGKIGKGGGK